MNRNEEKTKRKEDNEGDVDGRSFLLLQQKWYNRLRDGHILFLISNKYDPSYAQLCASNLTRAIQHRSKG